MSPNISLELLILILRTGVITTPVLQFKTTPEYRLNWLSLKTSEWRQIPEYFLKLVQERFIPCTFQFIAH